MGPGEGVEVGAGPFGLTSPAGPGVAHRGAVEDGGEAEGWDVSRTNPDGDPAYLAERGAWEDAQVEAEDAHLGQP